VHYTARREGAIIVAWGVLEGMTSKCFGTKYSGGGSMARMRTVHPLDFARLKRELGRMPTRDRAKYRKDLQQADAVVALVDEYLPHLMNH